MHNKSIASLQRGVLLLAVCCLLGGWAVAQSTAPQGKVAAPSSAPVNINQATAEQLTALPGVGEVIAQRIVDFRQKNGPFKKVEDLLAVRGIGEKSLERMKSRITL